LTKPSQATSDRKKRNPTSPMRQRVEVKRLRGWVVVEVGERNRNRDGRGRGW